MTGHRLAVLVVAVVALGSATGVARTRTGRAKAGSNVGRFAALTFGKEGGRAALGPAPAPEAVGTAVDGRCQVAASNTTFTEYCTPNGWLLRPAGTQVDTQRAPTGVTVSPNAKTVVAVNSGIFDEQISLVDTSTLAKTNEFTSDLYMGAAIDGSGNLWVSTGSRNKIFQYSIVEGNTGTPPTVTCVRCAKVFPGGPCNPLTSACGTEAGPLPSIHVIGYPGSMALAADQRLFVAGNISVPSTYLDGQVAGAGPVCSQSNICSVVNVVDVSNPLAPSPPVRYIPVGRDAFGLALNEAKGKLYVTNWADETNAARGNGLGTVSVVDIGTVGSETEVQVFPVGRHPTGVVLSPDKTTLFVANSVDDSLSKLTLDGNGLIASSSTISVQTTLSAPRAAAPLALGFTADGNYLLVGLAGQNAIEVRTAAGDAIPRSIPVEFIYRRSPFVRVGSACDTPANRTLGGSNRQTAAPPSCRFRTLHVPHTYIPAGWYPSAIASAAHPTSAGNTRLYATNIKGIGAGPGENAQAAPLMGVRTQGTLQVIDIPTDPAARSTAFDQWTATAVENNNWGLLFKRTRRDAATNPCRPAPLPDNTGVLSKFLCHEARRTGPSPYHVFYIVKENKTFDSFFGDFGPNGTAKGLPDSDADTTFLLFDESHGTKNQHNLARTFTLGDNFWADSEQSTTGHRWTSAGYANEDVEITWNPEYSQGLRGNRGSGEYETGQCLGQACNDQCGCKRDGDVDSQEGFLAEPAARLVDLLTSVVTNPRGITFRIYSDDVNRNSPAQAWKVPLDLWGFRTSFLQHGRDLDFPDTDRATLFLTGHTVSHAWSSDKNNGQPPPSYCKEIGLCGAPDDANTPDFPDGGFCARSGATPDEFANYSLASWVQNYNACRAQGGSDDQCQSTMPNFIYMALPVDHTLGFNPNSCNPNCMVADNDNATGLIMQELSKTPFWKNTLVLITEDDTQLTGDHVDAHRTFLLTAGGLSRQHGAAGSASHQASSFPSILKTIEVLFRLPSLAIYDRAAVPLHDFVVKNAVDRLGTPGYTKEDTGVAFAGSDGTCTAPPMNASAGVLARLSQKVDWRIDRGDPKLVTAIMYHGLRGWPLPEEYRKLAAE